MNIAIGLLILGLVIFLHELGHFLAAKLLGAPVPVFSIGFGPALFRHQWRETEYRLSVIPLGGYVIFGEEADPAAISASAKIFIYAAGPLANFLTALAIYQDLPFLLSQMGGLVVVVGQLLTMQIGLDSLVGPLGLVQAAGDPAALGFASHLAFIAFLSVNLGVLNLLPLPILDGGQILIAAAEGVTRRQVHLKIRVAMALATWALFLLLIVTVSYNDVARWMS